MLNFIRRLFKKGPFFHNPSSSFYVFKISKEAPGPEWPEINNPEMKIKIAKIFNDFVIVQKERNWYEKLISSCIQYCKALSEYKGIKIIFIENEAFVPDRGITADRKSRAKTGLEENNFDKIFLFSLAAFYYIYEEVRKVFPETNEEKIKRQNAFKEILNDTLGVAGYNVEYKIYGQLIYSLIEMDQYNYLEYDYCADIINHRIDELNKKIKVPSKKIKKIPELG